jgi:hypothetical protein
MKPLLLVATLVLGACEPTWFSVKIEASEVCVVDMSVVFPPRDLATEMQATLSEDDLGINLSEAIDLDITVSSVVMTPTDGADLSFAEEVGIEIGSMDDPALPLVSLVQLRSGAEAPAGGLYGEPDTLVDVTAYIEASDVVFNFELTGELPELPVQAGMDLCLDVVAGYSETFGSD